MRIDEGLFHESEEPVDSVAPVFMAQISGSRKGAPALYAPNKSCPDSFGRLSASPPHPLETQSAT